MTIETKFNVGDIVVIRRENSIFFMQIKRIEIKEDEINTDIIYYSTGDAGFKQTEVFSVKEVGLLKDKIVLKMLKCTY